MMALDKLFGPSASRFFNHNFYAFLQFLDGWQNWPNSQTLKQPIRKTLLNLDRHAII